MANAKPLYIGIGIVALLVIGSIILIAISLKTLQSYEVGFKYDTISMTIGDAPLYEGLHNGPPGFTFIKFSNVFKTMVFDDLSCLDSEGVLIYLDITYQYRVRPNKLKEIILQFKDNDGFIEMLRSVGESAIHDSCSMFNTSQFQSARDEFQTDLLDRIISKSDPVACDVTALQVNDIRRPEAYERAIRRKEAAREDIQVAMNEGPQRETAAQTLKREAETRRAITINRAEIDANIITRRAQTDAEAILNDFTKEAEAYSSLMQNLGLDVPGFLNYLATRALESSQHPVYIGMDAPARSSYP